MTAPLFDRTSAAFAGQIDAALAAGTYRRGLLFVDAVSAVVPPGGHVLDYGCGPGRIAALLAARGYRVDGRDPSQGMLDEARALGLDPARVRFDLLPDAGECLPAARYDAVVCSSVIEFVPDPAAVLGNLARTLKPGGLLAISFANRASLWRRYADWRYRARLPHLSVQHGRWTHAEARRLIETAGFTAVSAPVFFEGGPVDRRRWLRPLAASPLVGTLGFVTARRPEAS